MRCQYFKGTSSKHIPTPQQKLLGQFWFKKFLSILKSTTPYHIPNSKYSISGSTVIFWKYLSKMVHHLLDFILLSMTILFQKVFFLSSKKVHFIHKCHRGVKNFSKGGKTEWFSSRQNVKRNGTCLTPELEYINLDFIKWYYPLVFYPPPFPKSFLPHP